MFDDSLIGQVDTRNIAGLASIGAIATQAKSAVERYNADFDRIVNANLNRLRSFDRAAVQSVQADATREIGDRRAALVRELEGLAPEVKAKATTAQKGILAMVGRPAPKDSNEALLRGQREQRLWARYRPVLENEAGLGLYEAMQWIAEEAAEDATGDTFATLYAELEAFLLSKGEPVETYIRLLQVAENEINPAAQKARVAWKQLEEAAYRVTAGINYLASCVKRGDDEVVVLGITSDKDENLPFKSASALKFDLGGDTIPPAPRQTPQDSGGVIIRIAGQ